MSAVANYPAGLNRATAVDASGATQRAILISQRVHECLTVAHEIEGRLSAPSAKAGPGGSVPTPAPDHIVFAQEDSDRTLVELGDTLARIRGLL